MRTGQAGSARYHRCHPGRCPLSGWPGVRTDTVADRSTIPPARTAWSASQRTASVSGVPSTAAGVSMSIRISSPRPSSSPPWRRICPSRPGVQARPRRRVSWYTLRCARCSGTGRPAAMNAPEVTRAGSRRSGACLGTNMPPRSTAGTTYSGTFVVPFPILAARVRTPNHHGHSNRHMNRTGPEPGCHAGKRTMVPGPANAAADQAPGTRLAIDRADDRRPARR